MQNRLFTAHQNKLSDSESTTKSMYERVKNEDTLKDTLANSRLKRVINEGEGPYVGLAINKMCEHIDANQDPYGLGPNLNNILECKEKYLTIAREKCPVIGYYLTTMAHLDILQALQSGQYLLGDQNIIFVETREVLKNYYITEKLSKIDPWSFHILEIELRSNLEEMLNDKDFIRLTESPEEEVNKFIISGLKTKISKFENPLQNLEKKMDRLEIPTVGPFAEESKKAAEEILNEMTLSADNKPKL